MSFEDTIEKLSIKYNFNKGEALHYLKNEQNLKIDKSMTLDKFNELCKSVNDTLDIEGQKYGECFADAINYIQFTISSIFKYEYKRRPCCCGQ